jgi:hypothetical protein
VGTVGGMSSVGTMCASGVSYTTSRMLRVAQAAVGGVTVGGVTVGGVTVGCGVVRSN